MLYPQTNPYRQVMPLSEFWDIRFDPDDQGDAARWANGLTGGQPIAVPAGWKLSCWRNRISCIINTANR